MNALLKKSDQVLQRALGAFEQGLDALYEALDQLPAPIYVTDASGYVTYANAACTGFTGRRPAIGKDRWCVTWRLYTEEGEFLPHDQCPMAVALRQRNALRGMSAVAERPDGARVVFTPFPTPLLDAAGELVGAVNMLIDITDVRQLAELQAQAERCRRLAKDTWDQGAIDALTAMADEYDTKAQDMQQSLQAKHRDWLDAAGLARKP
jgi:PAS domain S-box-containing protein